MAERRGAIIPGLILVLVGAWLLAQNLGVRLPGLDDLWPIFPLLAGLAFLLQFFLGGRQDDGLVFVGTAAALIGVFFMTITLGPLEWRDMGRYWPVFVLIGGTAFLAQWLARPAQRGLLIPGVLALLAGGVALALTLGRADPALVAQVVKFWPLLLILAGLFTLASYFLRSGRPS